MRPQLAIALFSTLAVSVLADAQSTTPTSLTIGDNAPAFKSAGHLKGDKVARLEKGRTYVIEFWATWCGPCIASMPHLSDMADTYRGKVAFVSVNTWDFRTSDPKVQEEVGTHEKRVADWVAKNSEKMRYTVVLDDQKDTIATTWLRAAGRNGIPCAFIVNEEGKVAWIGHPGLIDAPLKAISEKTWDIAAFKTKFEQEAAAARAAQEAQAKLVTSIKEGNKTAVDSFIETNQGNGPDKVQRLYYVLSVSSLSNPEFAYDYLKKYDSKVNGFSPTMSMTIASRIAAGSKNAATKMELVEFSGKYLAKLSDQEMPYGYAYHAVTVHANGNLTEAQVWLSKARNAAQKLSKDDQDSVSKFLDSIAATIK